MIALAAALLAALVPQDEARLKDSWPKLVEAWKAVESVQAAPNTDGGDEFLRAAGKLHEAFESAGLYVAEGEYVPLALKAFIKARCRGWFRGGSSASAKLTYATSVQQADPMKSFLDSLSRLKALEKSRLDDEDNVQDELSTARKALKALGVTSDATPGPLRRRVLALARALALGDPYPEPARATEEQAKAVRELVAGLSHESIEEREKAVRELGRIGEAALPFVREALKSPDAEAAARARVMLGIGHAPWNVPQALAAGDDKLRFVEDIKIRAMKEAELKRELDRAVEKAKESR